MRFTRTIFLICLLLLFNACSKDQTVNEPPNDRSGVTKLSTKQDKTQQVSDEIKKILSSDETFTSIVVVNSDKEIIIAPEVRHMKRFQLKGIRKEMKDKIQKEYPNYTIIVSTDKKVIYETEQLRAEIAAGKLSKQEINKQVKELVKLTKEET